MLETIRFIVTAIPTDPVAVVGGGADADHDQTIEDNGEVAAFARFGNTWSRQQDVLTPLSGTLWVVVLAIGVGVAWSIEIRGPNNVLLDRQNGTTTAGAERVVGRIP